MSWPLVALVAYIAYLLIAFGLRTLVQVRRTGSSGFKGLGGRVGSAEWIAGVLFTLALVLGAVAAVLQLLDVIKPTEELTAGWIQIAGLVLFVAGLVATFAAQVSMGDSWRIGVDESERTELVTTGAFRLVRNPIFAAMLPATLGITLMVPNPIALVAFVGLFVAIELQVRVAEEPYLERVHGDAYRDYAAKVGRFVPGLGLTPAASAGPRPPTASGAQGPGISL